MLMYTKLNDNMKVKYINKTVRTQKILLLNIAKFLKILEKNVFLIKKKYNINSGNPHP